MTRPKLPADLAVTISDLLTIEAAARRQAPPSMGYRIARFLTPRLMPYSVGSFASVIMFFMMFTALRPHFIALREASASVHNSDVFMMRTTDGLYDLNSPEDFARSGSPSLNPDGKLAALSRNHAHSDHSPDADRMIVHINVFGNGAASLADVVEAPQDKRMLEEFQSALREDAAQNEKTFVRSSVDRRPDTMRVVFSWGQKVEVDGQSN
jgi:hypothetical protein